MQAEPTPIMYLVENSIFIAALDTQARQLYALAPCQLLWASYVVAAD
jgi:hypothetical protein